MSEQLVPILIDFLNEKVASTKNYKDRKEGPIFPQTKEAIKNCIEHRWLLNMYYEGDSENAPGRRWVEPYVWGNSKHTQNELLRVWQYRGTTTSIARGWKTFRLDRIRNTAPLTSKTFDRPRPKYNPNGDKLMSGVKMQVEFPGPGNRPSGGNKPDTTPPTGGAKGKNTVNRLKRVPNNRGITTPTSPGGIV